MALGSTLASQEVRARREVRPRGRSLPSGRVRMSPRLRQVEALLGTGLSYKEIAARLGLGEGTAKIYASEVYKLTGKTSRQILLEHRAAIQDAADGEPRMGAFE